MWWQEILHTVFARVFGLVDKYTWTQKYSKLILANKDISELVRGSGVAFVLKLVSLPLGLLTWVIISRWYGAEAMWLYGLVYTVIWILINIWLVGIWAALPRLLGEARAKNSQDEQAIYRTSLKIICISWCILSILLYSTSGSIALSVFDEPRLVFPLQVAAIFLLPLMIQSFHVFYLLATKKIYHSELISKIIVPLILLGIVSASYWIWPTYYIPIWAYLLSGGCGMLASIYILWRHNYIRITWPLISSTYILSISSPMLITGILGLVISYSDIVMIGAMLDTWAVWVYKVVLLVASLMTLARGILDNIYMPSIAQQFFAHQKNTLVQYLAVYNSINYLISWVILLVLLIGWKMVLWWYGAEFVDGYTALVIISCCLALTLLLWPTVRYLNSTWREKINLLLVWCGGVFNIIINYVLIHTYGIIWAAWWYGISIVLIYACTAIYTYVQDWLWCGIRLSSHPTHTDTDTPTSR